MVLMTVEAFEWIVLLTMADCATDNEIVPVKIVRTIFMTMDTQLRFNGGDRCTNTSN
jgi:hypothetical protein